MPAAYTSWLGCAGCTRLLLGREVAAGADGRLVAEVGEPDVRPAGAGGVEQQVGRLHVPVHDAAGVDGDEGLEQLVEHEGDVRLGQPALLGSEVQQRAAADQVHDDQDLGAVVAFDAVDLGQHVRVLDTRPRVAVSRREAALTATYRLSRRSQARYTGAARAAPDLVEERVLHGRRLGGCVGCAVAALHSPRDSRLLPATG